MTGLLVAALVVPLVGALAVAVLRDRTWVTTGASAVTAASWAALAAVDDVPDLGRIEVSPMAAVAVAGAALLTAAFPAGAPLARSLSLCALTVLGVAATTGDADLPDRPFAVGLAVLALLAALVTFLGGLHRERWRTVVAAVPVLAVAAGLLVDDAGTAAALVVVGAGTAVLAGAVGRRVVPAVLPGVLLAAARTVPVAHEAAGDGRAEHVPLAAAVVAVVTGAAVVLRRRRRPDRLSTGVPGAELPLLVVAAATVLLAQDLADLRGAGALLAAGGVLALASGHPVGLVAAVPGVAAAVEASGGADHPLHAAAAAAIALLVLGAGRPVWTTGPGPGVVVAAAFAVVPLWGWAGAPTGDHRTAAAVATATVAVVVCALALLPEATVPTEPGRVVGRLRRRSNAANHASTHTPVEEIGPLRGQGDPAEAAAEPREVPDLPQHPVAPPPRAVPRHPPGGGGGGRGRLRPRPGRPPG